MYKHGVLRRTEKLTRHGFAAALTGLIAFAVVAAGLTVTMTTAGAVTVPATITKVQVTPPTVNGGSFKITESWCVPNGSQPGDTFSQTLPVQLTGLPSSFTLLAADGSVVAMASVSNSAPPVATFTLGAFVKNHRDVCGTAYFSAYSSSNQYAGSTQQLNFGGNGKTTVVPVKFPPATTIDRTQSEKFGGFSNPGDQCRTNQVNCIQWSIDTPLGPFDSGVITDSAPAGQTFTCAKAGLYLGDASGPNGGFANGVQLGTGVTITCSPTSITATFGSVPAGKMLELIVPTSVTTGNNLGEVDYNNTASVKTVFNQAVTHNDTVQRTLHSTSAGGTGTGTQPPQIAITKWSTADGPTAGAYDSAPGKALAVNTPEPITMTVTNTGLEALINVNVSDATTSGPALTGLSCDFSALGGPSTGVTWAGPFAVGASFPCTGTVPAMGYGVQETDTATVNAIGQTSKTPVTDQNPWNGHTPPPVPSVSIVKGDTNGNAADTASAAVSLPDGTTGLVYTITNTGQEALKTITVSDAVVSNGTVTGLTCDFSPLGGPTSGVTWAGPFAVGAHFTCTATLSGVEPNALHEDIGTVTGTGVISGLPVTATNPYFATTPAAPLLAFTGAQGVPLAPIGAVLVLGGAAIIFAGRRRSGSSADDIG